MVTEYPDLDAMRAAFETSFTELKAEFEPEIDEHRAEVTAELGLTAIPVDELLTRLHTSLSLDYTLLNESGDEYDPL